MIANQGSFRNLSSGQIVILFLIFKFMYLQLKSYKKQLFKKEND